MKKLSSCQQATFVSMCAAYTDTKGHPPKRSVRTKFKKRLLRRNNAAVNAVLCYGNPFFNDEYVMVGRATSNGTSRGTIVRADRKPGYHYA